MTHFEWNLPYSSQREAVLGREVVATSQPIAAQAGLDILARGGNAVDAAVATAITLTVVEPTSNGIGSDAFALVWTGGGLHALNASGRSPRGMTPEKYAGMTRIPFTGWAGVTTPGAVSAWVELSRRFGRLPFEDLFEPAIRAARGGFLVTRQTAYYWDRGFQSLGDRAEWSEVFAPRGRPPRAGERVRLPHHAQTLELIARTNGDAFYHGELARRIADHARATDGLITEDDLARHAADWVRPLGHDFHGYTLHEIPPNGQGIVAQIALGILQRFRLDEVEVDSADSLHLQIEAMKLAFADGHRYIADSDAMMFPAEMLLSSEYLQERAGLIDRAQAGDPKHGQPKQGGTIYLATADREGTMVSFIQSNYTGFGSGVVVPGTGIALQNRGCCFSLEDDHPNRVGPGKRPYHTIIPAFVTRNNQPVMAFGVMGGFMQPQGHAQVMLRTILHRQNPQAALDAPRWRVESGRAVVLEPGFSDETIRQLRERGHEISIASARTVEHGGGQAIWKFDAVDSGPAASGDAAYFAASDLRRDGQAVAR